MNLEPVGSFLWTFLLDFWPSSRHHLAALPCAKFSSNCFSRDGHLAPS